MCAHDNCINQKFIDQFQPVKGISFYIQKFNIYEINKITLNAVVNAKLKLFLYLQLVLIEILF